MAHNQGDVKTPIAVDIDEVDDNVSDMSGKNDVGPNFSRTLSPKAKSLTIIEAAKKTFTATLGPILNAALGPANGERRTRSEKLDQGTATAAATSPRSAASISPNGEKELEHLIHEAEYEIHQDPYRGILSHRQSIETQIEITTPWHACEWGSLRPETIEGVEDLDDPQIVVRHVGNCACPTLKEWTRTLITERNKKKSSKKRRRVDTGCSADAAKPSFQVGIRPLGDTFVCPCDFNPLCLATLGGVIDQIIDERCRDLDPFVPVDGKEENRPSALAETVAPSLISRFLGKERLTESNLNHYDDGDSVEAVEEPPWKKHVADNKIIQPPAHTEIVDIEKVDNEHAKAVCKPGNDDDDESSDPFKVPDENLVASQTKPDSQSTAPRKTPLLKPLHGLPPGNPMDVFSLAHVPPQDPSCITFSVPTNGALKRCRSAVEVDTASIRSYVHNKLRIPLSEGEGDDKDRITVDKYMKILKKWNDMLIPVDPTKGDKSSASDKITLSMPPGIRNLGATCYLNTQLQCLAQNLTFLNGIFSWHVVDETHMMNSVMTKLQLLLAHMFIGGESKLTTLEFSNALGLEHHEQQDPNEFARLLFDRMDESFQQCDNDGDLSNLLNRIFHGVSTYETICLKCGTKSERNEGFMDLNLPIVKPPRDARKKSGTIEEAFASVPAKDVDTNLQYCLDAYTCAEMLDGENQYFCSSCEEKQDAKRILKLTELPPVLNVQLSRYVFDRTKCTKKKVCDKVLLPTSLNVTTGGVTKKFLLCAVMRHQGNSAYSGHYLAEAMDWMSGKWFEFNDENVRLLPGGPSSSFDPQDVAPVSLRDGETGIEKQKEQAVPLVTGSQDAYNMYYVDEGYLSTTVHATLIWRKELCHKGPNAGEVLDDVTDSRKGQFEGISKILLHDAQISDRLHRRRLGIRKHLFPNARSLVHANSSGGRSVWVSTKFLRTYLKCQPDYELDSLLESRDPIIQNNHRRCPHGDGLAPQVAQKGKLLSLHMYDTLVALLRGERGLLLGEQHDAAANDEPEIEDYMVGSDMNMICNVCSTLHRDILLKKLSRIRTAKSLFDALDPTAVDTELEYDETRIPESAEDRFTYAIARQSAIKFRKKFAILLKSLAKTPGGVEFESQNTMTTCEGLRAVDMSFIECGNDASSFEFKSFNESITCSHGSLLPTIGRQVQYISDKVWQMITELFPGSVEHKVKRTLKGSSDSVNYSCCICVAEKQSVEQLRADLFRWAKETKDEASLKSLFDTKRTLPQGQEVANFLNATNGCRLMHKLDIITWREAIKVLSILKRIKGENVDTVKTFVEMLVFPSRHAIVLEFETAPIDKFGASLRSFICREHHLVVRDAILTSPDSNSEESTRKLASYVTVVTDVEYQAYLESLASLLCILSHDRLSSTGGVGNLGLGDETKGVLESVNTIVTSHHPSIQLRQPIDTDPSRKLDLLLDGSLKEFALFPSMCFCESCSKEYTPLLLTDKEKDDDQAESISVGSNDAMPSSASKANAKRGSVAKNPVLVESDMEEEFKSGKYHLRVFQVKQSASEEEMFKALREVAAITSEADTWPEIRRSSRKRKQIYPVGVLLSEETIEVCVHYNIAAICLLMFQSGIQIDFSKLFVVVHQPFEEPKIFQTTTFNADLESTISKFIGDDENNVDIAKRVTLLYERRNDGSDPSAITVCDDLFHYSNIQENEGAPAKGSDSQSRPKKRDRPSERGFQGTLLQGFRPSTSSGNDGNDGNDGSDGKEGDDDVDVIEGHPKKPNDEGNDRLEMVNLAVPFIVADDSSVVSTRALSPMSPRREISSDDENSEDQRILNLRPIFGPSPWQQKGDMEISGEVIDMSANTEDEKDDDILQKLMGALRKAIGAIDEERCGLAATMALSANPQAAENDFDELLASAIESYLGDN